MPLDYECSCLMTVAGVVNDDDSNDSNKHNRSQPISLSSTIAMQGPVSLENQYPG